MSYTLITSYFNILIFWFKPQKETINYRTLHVADSTQYINYNVQAYRTNRRYKHCLPKPHLPDVNLNLNPIRIFSATLQEVRDPE